MQCSRSDSAMAALPFFNATDDRGRTAFVRRQVRGYWDRHGYGKYAPAMPIAARRMTAGCRGDLPYLAAEKRLSNEFADTIGCAPATRVGAAAPACQPRYRSRSASRAGGWRLAWSRPSKSRPSKSWGSKLPGAAAWRSQPSVWPGGRAGSGGIRGAAKANLAGEAREEALRLATLLLGILCSGRCRCHVRHRLG